MNIPTPQQMNATPSSDARICDCGSHGFVGIGKGLVALFSPEDRVKISGRTWSVTSSKNARAYARSGPALYMHRLLSAPQGRGMVVDHVNGDSLDNRRANLRICTHQQNLWNRRKCITSGSEFKGVSPAGEKWCYRYAKDGKTIYSGKFATALEAALAYDEAILKAYGEFARTNAMLGLIPQQMNTIPNGGSSSPANGQALALGDRGQRTNHKAGA